MELNVARDKYTPNSTGGQLWSMDQDLFLMYSLEPRADQSQGKPFCIPEGRYKAELVKSPEFGFYLPRLIAVPDFTFVEVHVGNFPKDTLACTLVGLSRGSFIGGDDVVLQSDLAFVKLMQFIMGDQSLTWDNLKEYEPLYQPDLYITYSRGLAPQPGSVAV